MCICVICEEVMTDLIRLPEHRQCPTCGTIALRKTHHANSNLLYGVEYFDGTQQSDTGGKSGFSIDDVESIGAPRKKYFDRFAELIASDAPINAKLLDFGSGIGGFIRSINGVRPDLVCKGLEVNEEVAKLAQSRGVNVVSKIHGDEQFDVITMIDVIEHLNDPIEAFNVISDVSSMGTKILISTPNAGSTNFKLFGKSWGLFTPPEHVRYYNVEGLRRLLLKFGWQITDHFTFGHLFHNERSSAETWKGKVARKLFGIGFVYRFLNSVLKCGPVLILRAERC